MNCAVVGGLVAMRHAVKQRQPVLQPPDHQQRQRRPTYRFGVKKRPSVVASNRVSLRPTSASASPGNKPPANPSTTSGCSHDNPASNTVSKPKMPMRSSRAARLERLPPDVLAHAPIHPPHDERREKRWD